MNRFVPALLGLALAGCGGEPAAQVKASPAVPKAKPLTMVAFTEGPTVYRDQTVFFSEMRSERILRYWPETREVTVFRQQSNGSNGLIFDDRWRLIACETVAGRVTRTDVETGEVEILADSFEGKRLNSPNDVTFDSQGRLYFSDRPLENPRPDQTGVHGVYRIDPDRSLHRILTEPDIDKPNGLVISPDDKTLYMIEANGRENGARMIRAYDLQPDGTVTNMRVFHDFYPGRSGDGMTIDSEGNLWVAAGLNRLRGSDETLDTDCGVHVFSPAGERIAFHPIYEDTITNAAFGGEDLKTLYVTAGKTLFEISSDVAGTRR